ncbi:RelA/SpoT family protein [Cyclobacterium marinum]|uniref:(P)ppGpp synthetase I, SpoT/RelA n=1 Tax=Cyclobacterium marinum (strain ATCC 25205 / DSM 745 / LMG 13164 / NCIMB 1802) TaxID=880070 RepID=G0J1E9_CYCMS|nr:bifunctional (p)ppGpp synthetase/guanosine-3',5'-bis(diphosphate) 3'-pyrophosphohydrolase [Cyclobacterium marinum]AEL26588.1 (p)ppGpp synthetase I, SpoT/RelA [Cyclobacterium marinum DSM 745]MBI0399917.1 bifunctional (p)ppGpp synthetase/guanosine-3',5'-bis(diphosphate) 3'-pyrophosphohydrolase [Cyclobacterium marinum]MBR9776385.1 bifunctional (p)ppGpp synthetase/guanosine-3',5'-bis(diphosphate) 3'-pyrophosphohydrolase [Cytophagales bacterium]|tara:strand:- start:6257 stop:8476 length:2220 start_codon:yes stop_codon:yes gene_type:complete
MIKVDIEEERKQILKRYRKLLRLAKPLLKPGDAKLIKKAFNVASEAHKEMRRKSGEPYIYHPLEVALICVEEIGLGTTSIIAALLHDVVEDTDMELEDIEREFGVKVAQIIDGLTKIAGVFDYGSSQQAENFRKMLLTLSDDVRVILIKLADRLNNMRTLDSMPRHKQLKIGSETKYLYAPLAHRLGLYSIKSELEDLYLKFMDKEDYDFITKKINDTRVSRNKFIKTFIAPIEKELKEQGFKFVIKGRPKSVYSIYNKMKKQNIPFEEVFDLFAIRIIIDTSYENEKAACWQVYSIVTDFYRPNPNRLRDWISTPRANGYESLHTTAMSQTGQWVEVQIRTQRMDDIAERGYAAHWKYKEKENAPEKAAGSLDEWITQVRTLLENNDGSAIEFMDDFRGNLFHDEVFVFTPKGDLKVLPFDATALDFAFEIHTEVGAKCIGAKVNQKLVSLGHKLKNGDQVEILTSNKQKPSEDWLKSVVTSRAKAKIKDALKEEKKGYMLDGKEIVQRKLKQMKLDFTSETVEQLRAFFETKTTTEFYYKVGKGIIDATAIKSFKDFKQQKKSKKGPQLNFTDEKSFTKEIKNLKGPEHDQLLIGEDMDVVDYVLAKCCNPIPGDAVFGFVTVNEGIKIHRTACPNALELMSNHGNRVIKARWTSQQQIAFLAGLKIIGTDRVGLISDLTKVISNELKVNMRSITVDSDRGIFEGSIKLYVDSTNHLEKLIDNLSKVSGVLKVSRFD